MINFLKQSLFILSMSLVISCGGNSKPSIKENSLRREAEAKKDYSDTSPEVLYKHVLAHFDLEEYKIGKDKLNSLILKHPELIDSLGLNDLRGNFDIKLQELQKQAEAVAAEKRKQKLPEEVLEKLEVEEEDGLTIYKDNSSPKFETKECFYIYYTKDKKGKLNLFVKIRYVSSTDWLNIKNVIVTVDKLDFTITGEVIKEETKGKKKYKTEVLIMPVSSPEKMEIVKAIANGSEVVALYVSDTKYEKREFTNLQRESFTNVLDAYLYMGGKEYN